MPTFLNKMETNGSVTNRKYTLTILCSPIMWKKYDDSTSCPSLLGTRKTCNTVQTDSGKSKREQPFRKCRSYKSTTKLERYLSYSDGAIQNHKLKNSSINENKRHIGTSTTSENLRDTRKTTDNESMKYTFVNSKGTQTDKENIVIRRGKRKVDRICEKLWEQKRAKANISEMPFKETPCSSKMTDCHEISACPSGGLIINPNLKLILDIIEDVQRQQTNSKNDVVTFSKLVNTHFETSVNGMDRKCINVYLQQKRIMKEINVNIMSKLTQLMARKEHKNIKLYILAMEIHRCLNQTDTEKFKSLVPELKKEISKFLKFHESRILEIYVDYMLCTFECRKRKDKFN